MRLSLWMRNTLSRLLSVPLVGDMMMGNLIKDPIRLPTYATTPMLRAFAETE